MSPSVLDALLAPATVDAPALTVDPIAVETLLPEMLRLVRLSLGMEMAFISEFTDGERIFRHVDWEDEAFSAFLPGTGGPLEESYCQRVVDGRLPQLIKNAVELPAARELEVTLSFPIGAHLSVPIRFSNGKVYGTFCCFSRKGEPSLSERDLNILRTYAQLASRLLEVATVGNRTLTEKRRRIQAVLDQRAFSLLYQPIVRLPDRRTVGYEALARFHAEPQRPPDQWFKEAGEVGLFQDLELTVAAAALEGLKQLPEEAYLSINFGPDTILKVNALESVIGPHLDRLLLEVTEHAIIDSYDAIAAVLAPLRRRGLQVAVDDAGAGYASFRHILKIKPDVIKLDYSIISGIDHSQDQHALAAALVSFAECTDIQVVAEGVETPEELALLESLHVGNAQGYLLGRPAPLGTITGKSPATRKTRPAPCKH